MQLTTSSGDRPLRSMTAVTSSVVADRIASASFRSTVIAPRSARSFTARHSFSGLVVRRPSQIMSANPNPPGKPRDWEELRRRVLNDGYLEMDELERRARGTHQMQY